MKEKTMTISLQRTIHASPAEVYGAWLDPEHPASPWNGADKLLLDVRPDGLFYWRHATDEGERVPHYGRFAAVERPRLVEYTWMSPYTHGVESMVKVRFEAKGADTLMTLEHANLPDDEAGAAHREGWTFFLDRMAERVATKKTR